MTAAIQPFPMIGRFRAASITTLQRAELHARHCKRGNLLERLAGPYDTEAGDALAPKFMSETHEADIGSISRGPGLQRRPVVNSECRLIGAGLADAEVPAFADAKCYRILPTHTGRLLALRIMRP